MCVCEVCASPLFHPLRSRLPNPEVKLYVSVHLFENVYGTENESGCEVESYFGHDHEFT